MTLKEAIIAAARDADKEFEHRRDDPAFKARMDNSIKADYAQMEDAQMFDMIVQGAPIYPVESRLKVFSYISLAFRFGMRVQRKIDKPDQETSMFWRTRA